MDIYLLDIYGSGNFLHEEEAPGLYSEKINRRQSVGCGGGEPLGIIIHSVPSTCSQSKLISSSPRKRQAVHILVLGCLKRYGLLTRASQLLHRIIKSLSHTFGNMLSETCLMCFRSQFLSCGVTPPPEYNQLGPANITVVTRGRILPPDWCG